MPSGAPFVGHAMMDIRRAPLPGAALGKMGRRLPKKTRRIVDPILPTKEGVGSSHFGLVCGTDRADGSSAQSTGVSESPAGAAWMWRGPR